MKSKTIPVPYRKLHRSENVPVHPRKLARSMARARFGMNKLSHIDWRRAAADQAKDPVKKGEKK